MSVVNRLADWPRTTVARKRDRDLHEGAAPQSAEIIILPCIRHERLETLPAQLASRA